MTQNTETSVMFALAELQQVEVARQAEERAREVRRLQEKEERERAERERTREAELQAQRVAEVAARLQLDVAAREAAAHERVTAMQQALIQIKAERDVLHEHLQTRDNAPAHSARRDALGPGRSDAERDRGGGDGGRPFDAARAPADSTRWPPASSTCPRHHLRSPRPRRRYRPLLPHLCCRSRRSAGRIPDRGVVPPCRLLRRRRFPATAATIRSAG